MRNKNNLGNRRNLLRTVGTGLAVGAVGALSGCLGQTDDNEAASSDAPEVVSFEANETDEEPSSDSSLAGSATGEPSGIERHNMSFRGRYNANHSRPFINYQEGYIYIYNMGGYVVRIEAFEQDVDDGEPKFDDTISLGTNWIIRGWGGIRVSVVGSNESIVLEPDVRDIEIWMGGATQSAYYWVGDF